MAAVKKITKQNGYGEKQTVRVITVDKERRRVECAMRDGAMIWAAIWETDTVFRWPEVGEIWTVRQDTGIWRLDKIVQSELAEAESNATPKTLRELAEGDARIIGDKVHVNNLSGKDIQSTNVSTENVTAKSVTTEEIAAPGLIYDFGLVSSLPTGTVTSGSMCTYKADSTNGIYWRLIYDESGEFPWKYIGGPPLYKEIATQQGTTSSSYAELATKGPELTIPALKGDYYCHFGVDLWNTTANCHARMGIGINGSSPSMEIDTNQNTGGGFGTAVCARLVKLPSVPASTVFLAKYMQISGGEATFVNRWISITPVRVG